MPGPFPIGCPELLPGLYLAALAVVLGAALRRFWESPPARLWASAAAAIALLCGPALFAGRVLLPLDSLRGEVPFRELAPATPHANPLQGDLLLLVAPTLARVAADVGAGRWPLWNPYAGAGMPLLADPQAQALQPLALLALPCGALAAAGLLAGLRLLLALVFFFLLLRRQGLGEGAAHCGALAYGLGGFLLLWLGWPLANAAAWLPVLLYGMQVCRDRGLARDRALVAASAFGLLLSGQPDAIVYGLAVAGAFAAALWRGAGPGGRWRFARRAGGALAVAGLVAAAALLPAARLLPQTLRAARLDERALRAGAAGAQAEATSAGRRWLQGWLPLAAPNAFGNGRYGDPTGLVYWGRRNTNEDASGFAGTLTLLAALLALGAGRGVRRAHERWIAAALLLALVALAEPPGVPWLVARLTPFGHLQRLNLVVNFALAYLAACELDRRFRGGGGRSAALLVAALLGALVAWGYLAHGPAAHPEALHVLRRGWLLLQGKVLVLGAALLAFAARERWAPAAAALLVAAELVTAHAPAWPAAPGRLALPEPPALAFLRRHAGGVPGRPPEQRIAALGGALSPNLAGLYDLADARVYNPVVPAAYVRLTAPLQEVEGEGAARFAMPGHSLYARLAVRYLLAAPGTVAPPPLRLVLRHSSGWIYEEPRARPLLFLEDGGARLAVERHEAARLAARVPRDGPRRLATGVYQDGGWRLLLDGRPIPTSGADEPLLAARLPPAGERLELLYRPPGFLGGVLLAALGLAGTLAAWGPPAAARLPRWAPRSCD
jgi:hypothetical protein